MSTSRRAQYGAAGVYRATPLSLTSGDSADPSLDAAGNLSTSMGSLLFGEDSVNDVLRVEQQYSYGTITTATTTLIKSGPTLLHTISIVGGALGAITVYDNTAASGTAIVPAFTPTATLPCPPIILDVECLNGITVVTAAATIITVSFRP